MLSKINHSKPIVGLAVTLLFLIALTCPAFAKEGTDGTELQVAQPQQLTIQLGPEWAGVEFQLKTDSGLYPGTIPVGEDGILRLEIGGSGAYTLTCLESPVQAPAPLPAADPAQESAAQVSQPSEPTIESHSHEPEPEQDPNLAGIPIWQLCLFGGGMVVAIASLIVLAITKRRRDEGEDEEEEEYE
ncbi:hypothetical protein AALD01_09590 [Oscillospiraceae bacterium 21-37]